MEGRSEWLAASTRPEGFEQMRLKSRPREPSPSLTRVGSNFYSAVKQQDYSASVWLRRKDKLEHSQQKCIVIFALVCCFAILVALIFSAVDIVGEDEYGLTEKNCQNNCRVALVENIPEGINYSDSAPSHLSLFQGWMNLLNMAKASVDIVSSQWNLSHSHPTPWQGQQIFEKLEELLSQNIEIKLVSDILHKKSKLLNDLEKRGSAQFTTTVRSRISIAKQDEFAQFYNQNGDEFPLQLVMTGQHKGAEEASWLRSEASSGKNKVQLPFEKASLGQS